MKHMLKSSLSIAALLTVGALQAVAPYYSPRSQGLASYRKLVGETNAIHLYDKDCFYGTFSVTPEWEQSFRSRRIAECLFGTFADCDCPTINISGSRVAGRSCSDWLADYFGLSTTFRGSFTVRPRVQNFIADLDLYLGLDQWLCGLYLIVDVPVVWSRWDLRFCETVTSAGTTGYDAGYFTSAAGAAALIGTLDSGANAIPQANLLQSFTSFINGTGAPNLGTGFTFNKLENAKFANCRLTKSGVADLRIALGWDFWQCEDFHFGLNIRTAAPTGNRPDGDFLFEPTIGNGKHWELGGGLNTHWTFWRSDCDDSSLSFWLEADLTYMFKARQRRTFDLVGKPMSRYMLAEKLTSTVVTLAGSTLATGTGVTAATAQFADVFAPVANLSTLDVKVRSSIQADVTAMFNYTNCGFSFDVGYNFWGRSCEKIEIDCDCGTRPLLDGKTWALKGDAFVYGFLVNAQALVAPTPRALSATESGATINAGTNTPCGTAFVNTQKQNPAIDNPQFAFNGVGGALLAAAPLAGATVVNAALAARTSIQPVFLSETSLDLCGARTRGLSSTVFAHFSYAWDCECWKPYLGIGGKAEFQHKGGNCDISCPTTCPTGTVTTTTTSCNTSCNTSCSSSSSCSTDCGDGNSCQTCNLSAWGVWIKGGISFD